VRLCGLPTPLGHLAPDHCASHLSRALLCACIVCRPLGPRVRASLAIYVAPHAGSALCTRALHRRSSVPEPLSSRAAPPICSPSCGTTTHAQLPVPARTLPTCRDDMSPCARSFPTFGRIRPCHPSQSSCHRHLVMRAQQSACLRY
jgi:hypothetical protein